jgi:hypothetical protein
VPVRRTTRGCVFVALPLLALQAGCTSVDPGPDFVIPPETFDPDYFYCHVEPQLIVAYKCGPGDPSKGDPPNADGCHYSSAVSGMALRMHDPVDCGGGDHPTGMSALAAVANGSPAESNFESVSLEMSRDYLTAPLYVRPLGHAHPRAVITSGDPVVQQLLSTWASK